MRLDAAILSFMMAIFFLACSLGYASPEYVVSSNYSVSLVLNGAELKPPIRAVSGDTVCVRDATVYLQQDRRLVFEGWDDGVGDPCRRVQGNHTALYRLEVLLQVYSEPRALRRSGWVEAGSLVTLDYPEVYYEDGSVRYIFESWSGGENPFQPKNTIYVSEPSRLEARYVKEYLITAVGEAEVNGTGWYREGEVAVLAARQAIYLSGGERLVFAGWESVGAAPVILSSPQSPVTAVSARGPYVLRAKYEKQYSVEVTGPRGVLFKGWIGDGEVLRVQADPTIQLQEGVRLRFAGWSSSDLPQSPDITIRVHQPYNVSAVYVKQYYLNVESQYGASGAGWYDEGVMATVRANPQPTSNILITRRLIGYSGDCGYDCQASSGVIALKMDSPKTVRAVYSTEPNLLTIGIISGMGGALVAVYALTGRRKPERVKREEGGAVEVEEPLEVDEARG